MDRILAARGINGLRLRFEASVPPVHGKKGGAGGSLLQRTKLTVSYARPLEHLTLHVYGNRFLPGGPSVTVHVVRCSYIEYIAHAELQELFAFERCEPLGSSLLMRAHSRRSGVRRTVCGAEVAYLSK